MNSQGSEDSRRLDAQRRDSRLAERGLAYTESNEPALFKAFEFIKDREGVAIGVGMDQMFDIAWNAPKLSRVIVFDQKWITSLVSESLLYIGSLHKREIGAYPSPEEFISYFAPGRIDTTLAILAPHISNDDFERLERVFQGTLRARNRENSQLYDYIALKAHPETKKEFESWLSSPESLAHILALYDSGRIHFIHGNLIDTERMAAAELLQGKEERVSVIYLSNVETTIDDNTDMVELIHNLSSLPINSETVVIETDLAGHGRIRPIPTPAYAQSGLVKEHLGWRMGVVSWNVFQHCDLVEREAKLVSGGNSIELGIQQYSPGVIVSNDLVQRIRKNS